MTELKEHEELVTMAIRAYENSTLDLGTVENIAKRCMNMTDAFIWGFIQYCESNKAS